jgi:hypothetical protein
MAAAVMIAVSSIPASEKWTPRDCTSKQSDVCGYPRVSLCPGPFGGFWQRSTTSAYRSCTTTSGNLEPGPPKSLAASAFTARTSLLFRLV